VALLLGWRTRWVKWLVLIGHVSLLARNPHIYYGVDGILASLLLILCVSPAGASLSLDSVRRQRQARRANLAEVPAAVSSRWGFACLRLLQIQMAVFYFYAGVEKIQGSSWWHGSALWIALNNHEYANIPIGWMAEHVWTVNVLSYYTILLELAYPFLIWGRATRPYLLVMAILLHLGIAVMMGLYVFSFVMIVGHLAFLRHEWLAGWGKRWKERIGPLEMIYDGDCGFCKRSMAWLLAFDGLGQIRVRDYRRDPSPVVASELVDKALYVVLPDGRHYPGFDAYRHVVLRVPGLWWQVPFFYIPVVSRFFGRRIYRWVASHRHEISACRAGAVCRTDRP
jgi:predicted DCC family thiol-disulfide oxidoreductase YuxK